MTPDPRANHTPRERLELTFLAAACILGLFAPWNYLNTPYLRPLDGSGPNAHTWGVASAALAKTGIVSIASAFAAILALGIAFAFAAAALRTWASARGHSPASTRAHALGAWLHVAALALLMPLSGAVFALSAAALVVGWMLRTPPAPRPGIPWPTAFLRELYEWGVAGSFAFAGWRYDAQLLLRCVIVSAGVGLLVRGFIPRPAPP